MTGNKNEKAVTLLERLGITNASYIVNRLVENGYITPDPPKTRPEEIVDTVKRWLKTNGCSEPMAILDRAMGWDTAGWEVVLEELTNIPMRKDIFRALQILAEEAGEK